MKNHTYKQNWYWDFWIKYHHYSSKSLADSDSFKRETEQKGYRAAAVKGTHNVARGENTWGICWAVVKRQQKVLVVVKTQSSEPHWIYFLISAI